MGTFILGVNSAYHESSACLIHEGRIIAAVEEERFNRVKHAKHSRVDNAHHLPWQSIEFCLRQAGITPDEVAHVGYSLDPEARRGLNRELPDSGRMVAGDFGAPDGEETFYQSNLEARRLLLERFTRAQFHFIEHHLCHAASAYVVSPFDDAAILTIDGIGEFHSTWLGYGHEGKIEPICRIPYPHSLGFLWEKMSELLGFDSYSGPGKMMGYGCITDPLGELSGKDHLSTMREILRLNADGSFWIDNDVMRFRTRDFSELERRFGPRRKTVVDRYEDASIAAALQLLTEEAILNLARGAYRLVQDRLPRGAEMTDALCMAGGVSLNCVANDRILRETPFSRLWVQPAANDAGTAVGAAAYLHCQVLDLPGRPWMEHGFTGPAYDDAALADALDREGLPATRCSNIAAEVARRLEQGQVVAWFQGALELGPRALGHRSILADPTRFDMRSRINAQVKMRESFRPFAPSVMESAVEVLFDLPEGAFCADYMLTACPLKDDRVAQMIPAVVQENGSLHRSTARLHRVSERTDPLYHAVIEEMRRYTGVGAILNTSFNISEPIVATPEQAIRTFCTSGMDAMAIGPYLVEGRQ
jgi:carbamoyltransferase